MFNASRLNYMSMLKMIQLVLKKNTPHFQLLPMSEIDQS